MSNVTALTQLSPDGVRIFLPRGVSGSGFGGGHHPRRHPHRSRLQHPISRVGTGDTIMLSSICIATIASHHHRATADQ
jgi:hypothetical protein